MGSEIALRLAIDRLRVTPNQDAEVLTRKRLFLIEKMVQLKKRQSMEAQLG